MLALGRSAHRLAQGFGRDVAWQRRAVDPGSATGGETDVGEPVTVKCLLDEYKEGEKEGIPGGTAMLILPAGQGVDPLGERWAPVSIDGLPARFYDVQNVHLIGGGDYAMPVVMG